MTNGKSWRMDQFVAYNLDPSSNREGVNARTGSLMDMEDAYHSLSDIERNEELWEALTQTIEWLQLARQIPDSTGRGRGNDSGRRDMTLTLLARPSSEPKTSQLGQSSGQQIMWLFKTAIEPGLWFSVDTVIDMHTHRLIPGVGLRAIYRAALNTAASLLAWIYYTGPMEQLQWHTDVHRSIRNRRARSA